MTTTKNTDDITESTRTYAGRTLTAQRYVHRTAYARNGNVGNPTRYYRWNAFVDGKYAGSEFSKADAFELAQLVVDTGETLNPSPGAPKLLADR